MQQIVPFLTFTGRAEEAMNFYVSVFPRSEITAVRYIAKGGRGAAGKVLNGTFTLMGQRFMAMDMEPKYGPQPSWNVSFYIDCRDEAEFDALFAPLAGGGTVVMGPEPVYGLRKVAWVTDKFGVTWQLVWE